MSDTDFAFKSRSLRLILKYCLLSRLYFSPSSFKNLPIYLKKSYVLCMHIVSNYLHIFVLTTLSSLLDYKRFAPQTPLRFLCYTEGT